MVKSPLAYRGPGPLSMLACWAKYPVTVHKVSPSGVFVVGRVVLIWLTTLLRLVPLTPSRTNPPVFVL